MCQEVCSDGVLLPGMQRVLRGLAMFAALDHWSEDHTAEFRRRVEAAGIGESSPELVALVSLECPAVEGCTVDCPAVL